MKKIGIYNSQDIEKMEEQLKLAKEQNNMQKTDFSQEKEFIKQDLVFPQLDKVNEMQIKLSKLRKESRDIEQITMIQKQIDDEYEKLKKLKRGFFGRYWDNLFRHP